MKLLAFVPKVDRSNNLKKITVQIKTYVFDRCPGAMF